MPTGTEAYQGSLDAINANTLKQQEAFAVWFDKVVTEVRKRGYTVKARIDTSGDGVFVTPAEGRMDVTKEGITARVLYNQIHVGQSPATAARLADTAWLSVKHSAALGFAPMIGGDPVTYDPIKSQTSFNLNVEVPFATTKLGAPAISLPPINQPGVTSTTVPPGSGGTQTAGQSPQNPANGTAPVPPIVIDTGGVGGVGGSGAAGGSGSGTAAGGAVVDSGMDTGTIIAVIALAILVYFVMVKG